jgi:imidazolonepropionase-like amidohydrolase
MRINLEWIRVSRALFITLTLSAGLHAEVTVLRNFCLIDGTGRPPITAAAMIIDNGRIAFVGTVATLKVPTGAQVLDLTGKYVMPGIVSLHGHMGNTSGMVQDYKFYTRESVEKDLKTYASYGVTTVLSLGMDQDLIFKIRDEQHAAVRPSMTRVFTAGQGLIGKDTFGGLAGLNVGIPSVADVDAAVAEQARKKVDIIKFWIDDSYGTQKKMPIEMAKAIVASAHKYHLPVAAHVFYLADAIQLADAGIDGFAHNVRDQLVNQALVDSMKKHGTWLMSATLSREASMFAYAKVPPFATDPFFLRSVPAATVAAFSSPAYQKTVASLPRFDQYPTYLANAEKNLKTLADAGVRYGMGTDAGPPGRFQGFFEHWEMELMNQAGLTPMQVIVAATRSGAEFLKVKDLGTLEKNKWADLIVLDADPLVNIKNTRTIHAVYLAGKQVR